MPQRPIEVDVPADSRASTLVAGANFHDAWSIETQADERPVLALFIAAALRTPRWVDACMRLRNRVGAWVGLKDLGMLSSLAADKPASAYQVGERVGIFTVLDNGFNEALIGDTDRHLDVVLSIHRGAADRHGRVRITVATIVHVKNRLGLLYMLPVRPMHRLIAPAVLARAA